MKSFSAKAAFNVLFCLAACVSGLVSTTIAHSNDDLIKKVSDLENEVRILQQGESSLHEEVAFLTNHVHNLQQSQQQRTNSKGRNLDKSAFTAMLSGTVNISPGTVVVFDSVLTDPQGDYNPTFGFFEAKDNGLYLFFITITSPPGEGAEVLLQVVEPGGNTIEYIIVRSYVTATSEQPGAHSASVVIELTVGDTVSVVAAGDEAITLAGGATTLFGGYFL